MPGVWITKRQVELYMQLRKEGLTQIASAAKAGMSERRGRTIEKGLRQAPRQSRSIVRTRPDPLVGVWESELVPMLEKLPLLQPITLLEYLQDKYVDDKGNPIYPDSLLRTLQRRIKLWKAMYGPQRK